MQPKGTYYDGPLGRQDRGRLLLVEGQDDAAFFDHLLSMADADPNKVGILYIGGKTNLANQLTLLKKGAHFQSGAVAQVAIVRDADESAPIAWKEINATLGKVAWPKTFSSSGFQGAEDGTRVGVLLLPNDETAGDLERLCLGTKEDDPIVQKSIAFQTKMAEEHGPFDRPFKRQAAIFLANVHTETRGVGSAFSKGVFDETHHSLHAVKAFVSEFAFGPK